MTSKILLVIPPQERNYVQRLKPHLGVIPCSVLQKQSVITAKEITVAAKASGFSRIVTTSQSFLACLSFNKKASLTNFAGSIFTYDGCEILILESLERLIDTPYQAFLTKRYLSKFTEEDIWTEKYCPNFDWASFSAGSESECQTEISSLLLGRPFLISLDIETLKEPLAIDEFGACFFFKDGTSKSIVIKIRSMQLLEVCKQICASPFPKVFQNGKYDLAYLTSWGCIVENYFFDTATAMHSWYAELPKDLAFLAAFFIRDSMYWKDMAASDDQYLRLQYNARDTWATGVVAVNQILEMPAWARDNFILEFPLLFPCHLVEMQGIRRDEKKLEESATALTAKESAALTSLQTMVSCQGFNPASPKQMQTLLLALGCADLKDRDGKLSTDEKTLAKAMAKHPLNARILNKVLDIRGIRKMLSTYLTPGKEFRGRILFSLNPHGTDTGRMASKEHHFWCGLQIQNIPGGDKTVKETLVADPGWLIAENDLSKAESWGTAFISGDENLIAAVKSPLDFHKVNASAFFGIPYDEITKSIRQLAKRVNHGANYNMGPYVLVDTMGIENIMEAKRLLKLPKHFMPKQVAEFLLESFHKTYPKIRSVYYAGAVNEIKLTGRLKSKVLGDRKPWTRRCFGNPDDKRWLNAYAAHCPQSLNAMNLNRSFMRIFYDLAIHPDHRSNFRLLAQIHDSVLYTFREGMHEFYTQAVKERMEIAVTIEAYDGVTRTYICPADIKAGPDGLGVQRWSQTE